MDTMRICSGCKKPLPTNAPEGLCPECLLKAGLGTGVDIGPDTQSASGRIPFVAPTLEELAKRFPQLEILSLIGQGGMGAVYRARQKQLDRVVALKILPPGIGSDPAFAERFTREARAMARLNHPGVVTLFEFGQADGLYFFLMEFVDGVNLRQLLEGGRLSPREALAIVPQICDALQYAHDQGIVHRDIKPENIMLDRQGRVKVADFGLAKLVGAEPLTRPSDTLSPSDGAREGGKSCSDALAASDGASAGVGSHSDTLSPSDGERAGVRGEPVLTDASKVMGTPAYMAPEQRRRPTEVDHRADIYSLGVVFYQMLTGELPGQKVEPPSKAVRIDVRLDDVVLRALEEEPRRRYQHASEVKADVETIAGTPAAVAAASAAPPAAAASASGATRRPGPAQLSQKAVIGAVWAPFFMVPLLSLFLVRVLLNGAPPRPEWWQSLLLGVLLPLGVTAPFGTTILGAIALSQIRRSAGRLQGLGLALFDSLCFPLLALDALIVWLLCLIIQAVANGTAIDSPPFITALAILVCVAVDAMIVVWAWRAARTPVGVPSESRALPTRRAARIGLAVGGLTFLAVAILTFLLPKSYVSTAKVVVRPVSGEDLALFSRYRLGNEFEVIQSTAVLTNVIARLDLERRWGERFAHGDRLDLHEAVALLQKRLEVAQTGTGSSVISINFTSEQRTEAAEIANTVAECYQSAQTPNRVAIVQQAQPALRPVRPSVMLNLSIGALVGLVLGGLASGFGASGLAWFLAPPVLCTWFLLFGYRVFGVDLDADEQFWCGVIGLPASATFGALLTGAMRLLKKTEPGPSATPAGWSWLSIGALAALVLSLPLGGGMMVMGQLIAQESDWNPSSGELVFTLIFGAGTGLLAVASVLLGIAARRQIVGAERLLRRRWGALAATWFWPCLAGTTLAFGLIHSVALSTLATRPSAREQELQMMARLEQAEAAAAAQRFTFGPVIERALYDPDDDPHDNLLDLDSGRMMDCPVPWPKSSASRTEWQTALKGMVEAAEREAMDALSDASGNSLQVFRLAVVPAGANDFDQITAATARAYDQLAGREHLAQVLHVENPPATFWFKTGAGATGLLQITGFTENVRAVKLRYKLIQPAVPTATQSAAATAFGPVFERVLPCSAPCRMQYLQFHTGNVITIGDGPGDKSDHTKDYGRAEESGGIDASVIGGREGIQLAGKGCVFTRDKSPDWDATTAEVVVRTLQRESWLSGVVEIKAKDFPATWLFKTARGECGILQILGVTDEPPGWNQLGMKFRYKLVLPGRSGPGQEAAQSEPADLREARARLAELRVTYGEGHPEVRAAIARVQALEIK